MIFLELVGREARSRRLFREPKVDLNATWTLLVGSEPSLMSCLNATAISGELGAEVWLGEVPRLASGARQVSGGFQIGNIADLFRISGEAELIPAAVKVSRRNERRHRRRVGRRSRGLSGFHLFSLGQSSGRP